MVSLCPFGARGFKSHSRRQPRPDVLFVFLVSCGFCVTGVSCMLPFVVTGCRMAGLGWFLACLRVLGLDWGFPGSGKSPWKALENWLGWLVSESGLILGYFLFRRHARTAAIPGHVLP